MHICAMIGDSGVKGVGLRHVHSVRFRPGSRC